MKSENLYTVNWHQSQRFGIEKVSHYFVMMKIKVALCIKNPLPKFTLALEWSGFKLPKLSVDFDSYRCVRECAIGLGGVTISKLIRYFVISNPILILDIINTLWITFYEMIGVPVVNQLTTGTPIIS